jgi:hypothetical protein
MRIFTFVMLFGSVCSLTVAQDYSKVTPPQPKSTLIASVIWDAHRVHKADGDTWPLTWAADNNLYGAAGDNQDSPMNFWKIVSKENSGQSFAGSVYLVNNLPVDCEIYCKDVPGANPKFGIKPAGLISIGGTLYFSVENMNYGENPAFNRQHNISGWIITSNDFGKTWNLHATPQFFFKGRTASAHFLNFGKDNAGARDEFVYAYFPAADDGNSYWENNDYILLGRVPKARILERSAWEFYIGSDESGQPRWDADDKKAVEVFRYARMTGENHVTYDKGLKRYLMGNYGFHDGNGNPRPYHTKTPESVCPSQLTLYEAPEPWGPWSQFYKNDDFGRCGVYNPSFPPKLMSEDGLTLWMVYAGSWEDYNFTVQKLTLVLAK